MPRVPLLSPVSLFVPKQVRSTDIAALKLHSYVDQFVYLRKIICSNRRSYPLQCGGEVVYRSQVMFNKTRRIGTNKITHQVLFYFAQAHPHREILLQMNKDHCVKLKFLSLSKEMQTRKEKKNLFKQRFSHFG